MPTAEESPFSNLVTPSGVQAVLARHGLHPRKALGQHFLVDRHVLERILEAAAIVPTDTVLEVGPGLGTLTGPLALRAARVVAVEADRRLARVLEETVGHLPQVRILLGDALEVDLPVGPPASPSFKLVSNLPYQITSPILLRVLAMPGFALGVVMVQREVALRMVADPGTPEYGAFTVAVRHRCRIEPILRVPRTVFFPPPEVESAVVRLVPREVEAKAGAGPDGGPAFEAAFEAVVRAAFAQRRKKLRNALLGGASRIEAALAQAARPREPGWWVNSALEQAGLDGNRRGETLSVEEFRALAQALVRCYNGC